MAAELGCERRPVSLLEVQKSGVELVLVCLKKRPGFKAAADG